MRILCTWRGWDCRSLGMSAAQLDKFMLTKARVWLDKGQKFGVEGPWVYAPLTLVVLAPQSSKPLTGSKLPFQRCKTKRFKCICVLKNDY